ncbi:MAG: All-trans-phytoene synthase [Pseudomonadota bacterium]|jgi:farnesyl-diphosphate farnesyltransferase
MTALDPKLQAKPTWAPLLQQVARSFALSVRVLPDVLRRPVALGYLLARASDSIADSIDHLSSDGSSTDLRLQALNELHRAIQTVAAGEAPPLALQATMQCLEGVPEAAERALLRRLPDCLLGLSHLSQDDRRLLARVCDTIISGQQLDLNRFGGGPTTLRALDDEAQYNDYTWRVAGCVGLFWTDLAEAHVPDWRQADLAAMQEAGCRYGMGLQRLNLLRDSAHDLAQGRCYWPRSQLALVGLDASKLALAVAGRDAAVLAQMAPCLNDSMDKIRSDLTLGLAYALAVRPWRLRLASALPALIGLRTLQALERAGPMALTEPVKVPRAWVRGLLMRLCLGGLTTPGLRALGRALGVNRPIDLSGRRDGTMAS